MIRNHGAGIRGERRWYRDGGAIASFWAASAFIGAFVGIVLGWVLR